MLNDDNLSYQRFQDLGFVTSPATSTSERLQELNAIEAPKIIEEAPKAVPNNGTGVSQPPERVVTKIVRPEPVKISENEVENLSANTALIRTAGGDALYPLFGADFENPLYVVLYIREENINFNPAPDNHYWVAVNIEGEGTFNSKVYYPGVNFALPTDGDIKALILFVVK